MMLISGPLLFSVATVPHTLLQALYGAKRLGRIELETRAQWHAAAIMMSGVYAGGWVSAVMVACTVVALYSSRFVVFWRAFDDVLALHFRAIACSMLPGLAMGVIAAAGTALGDRGSPRWLIRFRLEIAMTTGGIGTVVELVLAYRQFLRSEVGHILLSIGLLPAPLRAWFARRGASAVRNPAMF